MPLFVFLKCLRAIIRVRQHKNFVSIPRFPPFYGGDGGKYWDIVLSIAGSKFSKDFKRIRAAPGGVNSLFDCPSDMLGIPFRPLAVWYGLTREAEKYTVGAVRHFHAKPAPFAAEPDFSRTISWPANTVFQKGAVVYYVQMIIVY